jgi:phosphatidylglycerophosphate synthase
MLANYFKNHLNEVLKTIKLIEIEETFDIYFSRFFGLYLAKLAKYVSITPTQVSLISLVIGVVGGSMLYYQLDTTVIMFGCILITLAGVLDSADGQLARMTNSSSELGRMVDGTIDNLVFFSVYVAGCWYLIELHGWIYLAVGLVAMLAHSYKSALYDLYKSEFSLLVGQVRSSRTPTIVYAIGQMRVANGFFDKLLYLAMAVYTNQELMFSTRDKKKRDQMENLAFGQHSVEFIESYRDRNSRMLTWWALICGTNTHRTLIMVFSLMGRIDLYLFVSVITFLPMLILAQVQKKQDNIILAQFGF